MDSFVTSANGVKTTTATRVKTTAIGVRTTATRVKTNAIRVKSTALWSQSYSHSESKLMPIGLIYLARNAVTSYKESFSKNQTNKVLSHQT